VVSFEEAFKVVDDLVFAEKGRHLLETERIIMQGAWDDKGFEEIADNSPYSLNYLQRTVAPQLWAVLSEVLGKGMPVGKKKLRYHMEQVVAKNCSQSLLDAEQLSHSSSISLIVKGHPPNVSVFYGRTKELTELRKLVVNNRCIGLFGTAGIGKSALVAKLIEEIKSDPHPKFDYLVWKSVHYGPHLEDLATDLNKLLVLPLVAETSLPESRQPETSVLLNFLYSHRCLLVLDGAERWLQGDREKGFNPYGQYAECGVFLRRVVEEQHQSCLVLTSQEPFKDLAKLQRSGWNSCMFKVEGLDLNAAKEILRIRGLTDEHKWEDLLKPYLGNSLAIELVASRIKEFFGGSAANFLKYKIDLISEIFRETLAQHFVRPGRLTYLEKQILLYLAEKMVDDYSPIAFTKLFDEFKVLAETPISVSELITAVEALRERSLLEAIEDRKTKELFFNLPTGVKRYVLKERAGLLGESRQIFKVLPEPSVDFAT